MLNKKEILALVVSIFILSFVFGFDDGSSIFELNHWLFNFFKIFLLVGISILFRELIVKLFASRHECRSEYEIWNVKQVWFNTRLKFGFPFGVLFSLILAIASKGNFFFTAIGSHKIIENKTARVGRKFQSLQYYEEAQIASMGILASLFVSIIAMIVGEIFDINISGFVIINFYLALFNMLPFSDLDGAKIFFGSIFMYTYLLVFIVVAFLLMKFSIILGLVIALLMALIATGFYFYFSNK